MGKKFSPVNSLLNHMIIGLKRWIFAFKCNFFSKNQCTNEMEFQGCFTSAHCWWIPSPTVGPMENWLGSSVNHMQVWRTVWGCCCHAFEKGCLLQTRRKRLNVAVGSWILYTVNLADNHLSESEDKTVCGYWVIVVPIRLLYLLAT